MAPSRTNTRRVYGIGLPAMVPNPNSVNQYGQTLMTRGPSTMFATPRNSASVPSVTTSEGMPARVTRTPLNRPPSAPISSTTGADRHRQARDHQPAEDGA